MLRRVALAMACLIGCGGGDATSPDGGDGGGGDATVDGGGGSDGSSGDASNPPADSGTDGASSEGGAGDGGDAGNDAAASLPLNISGVVLWLDAAKGVTQTNGAVSGWTDLTSFHNDASQATASLRPTYAASVINGLPALHFDPGSGQTPTGRQLVIADSTSLQFGTADYSIYFVARFKNDPQATDSNARSGTLWAKAPYTNFTGYFLLFDANLTQTQQAGLMLIEGGSDSASYAASYADDASRLYVAGRSGQSLQLRVNGAAVASATQSFFNSDVSQSGRPVYVGALTMGTQAAQFTRLDGDIAEIVAVKGTISTSDLASLEGYLVAKYAL